MGIRNLGAFIKKHKLYEIRDISELDGKLIIIDASVLIFKWYFAIPLSFKGTRVGHLVGAINLINKLDVAGISSIWVFDGKPEYTKKARPSSSIEHRAFDEVAELVRACGLRHVCAGDSDIAIKQIVHGLSSINANKFAGVYSTDTDFIAHSLPLISFYANKFVIVDPGTVRAAFKAQGKDFVKYCVHNSDYDVPLATIKKIFFAKLRQRDAKIQLPKIFSSPISSAAIKSLLARYNIKMNILRGA